MNLANTNKHNSYQARMIFQQECMNLGAKGYLRANRGRQC